MSFSLPAVLSRQRQLLSWLPLLGFGSLLVLLSLLCAGPIGQYMESTVGTPLLFTARNLLLPPPVPHEVLIITPFRDRRIGTPDHIRDWDRRDHAKVIDTLVRLGAGTIAVDLFFREPNTEQDAVLAHSIATAPSVVLNQIARPVRLERGNMPFDVLRSPVSVLADAATRLAPAIVSANAVRADRIPLYYPVYHQLHDKQCFGLPIDENLSDASTGNDRTTWRYTMVPTLPVVVLEQQLGIEKTIGFLSQLDPNATQRLQALRNNTACYAWQRLRSFAHKTAHFSKQGGNAESRDFRLFSIWHNLQKLKPNERLYQDSANFLQINYYGPPATLYTYDYQEIEALARQVESGREQNPVHGRAVFIGGSFESADDQKEDAFVTVFSDSSSPMSGVEIAASTYANLVRGEAINSLEPWWASVITMSLGVIVLTLGFACRTRLWLGLSCGMLSVVALSWVMVFAENNLLIPLVTPIVSIVVLIAVFVLWRLRVRSAERDRARQHLTAFLSDTVASQLDSDRNHVLRDAVCIVTDIRNFTAIGRTLDPATLHRLNDEYFTLLFACVSQEGAEVIKTYGDSMTAVWTSSLNNSNHAALRAGLSILDAVTQFNAEHPSTPFKTNIGLSCGEVAIGYVGDATRRTVELTGSTIYLASRLEQLNKGLHSSFLTTADFMPRLTGVESRSLGLMTVKGYDKLVDVVEIVGVERSIECSDVVPLL